MTNTETQPIVKNGPRERPILFSGPMVRAILDGRKSQTRRVVKPQPACSEGFASLNLHDCPYQIGRAWVRETFAYTDEALNIQPGYVYRATDPDWSEMEGFKWKPAIYMPRQASRITLELTSIRVERLQDISEEDAIAEGLFPNPKYPHAKLYTWDGVQGNSNNPCYAYQLLWESINGANSWAENPWVWVVTFVRTGWAYYGCSCGDGATAEKSPCPVFRAEQWPTKYL